MSLNGYNPLLFWVFFPDKAQCIVNKSHIHFINKSSAELFPYIHNLFIAKIVCRSISNLLAEFIIKNSKLHLSQFVDEGCVITMANFMAKSPTLKYKKTILGLQCQTPIREGFKKKKNDELGLLAEPRLTPPPQWTWALLYGKKNAHKKRTKNRTKKSKTEGAPNSLGKELQTSSAICC